MRAEDDEEEFIPDEPPRKKRESKKHANTLKLKTALMRALLLKDKDLNSAFDEIIKTKLKDAKPSKKQRLKPNNRGRGRPSGGGVVFEQARIDALPEIGHISDLARALDVKHTSLQQWCEKRINPLPFVVKAGFKLFRKDVVVKWLVATKRFKGKL